MKRYEVKHEETDPYVRMCDCPEHEIETIERWEPVSENGLHEIHKDMLFADEEFYDCYREMYGSEYEPTPQDFNLFLSMMIRDGYIREIA